MIAPVAIPLPFRVSPVDSTYAAPPKTNEKPARCMNGGIFAFGRRSVGGMSELDATAPYTHPKAFNE